MASIDLEKLHEQDRKRILDAAFRNIGSANPFFVGMDFGSKPSETRIFVYGGGRQQGKTAAAREAAMNGAKGVDLELQPDGSYAPVKR
jgi:hypothetical protein